MRILDRSTERELAGKRPFGAACEEHETESDAGLTAAVDEGEGLEPYSSAAATT